MSILAIFGGLILTPKKPPKIGFFDFSTEKKGKKGTANILGKNRVYAETWVPPFVLRFLAKIDFFGGSQNRPFLDPKKDPFFDQKF